MMKMLDHDTGGVGSGHPRTVWRDIHFTWLDWVVLAMTLVLGLGPTAGGIPTTKAFSFLEKLFTCMSAFATVGLDVGVTAELNRWGQLVLMVGMFTGRLGVILLLSALYGRRPQSRVGYPREEVFL